MRLGSRPPRNLVLEMTARIFDDIARSDAKPARHGEDRFAFLNRSASRYFGMVRDLVEEWFSHFPEEHQSALRGGLRSDDEPSASAFWELYLHEAYRRSGYEIAIHPKVASRTTRPDFLLTRGDERFYLEAVSVGRPAADIAEDSRLDQVHRVLSEMLVEDFSIELSTKGIGPASLATKKLRSALLTWLSGLDPAVVTEQALASPRVGFACLPQFAWEDAGWSLVFHAYPRGEWARGVARPALGMMGPGEATIVDNVRGITRVLDSKRNKYGPLDAPLVVAVQSNTEYPTHDYEVENALYGTGSHRPADRARGKGHLFEEGLWFGRAGWRNADMPQVVTVYGLAPWTVARTLPRCWSTLEPGVDLPDQPAWLAPMIVGDQSLPGDSAPISAHFGLPEDWPWSGDPDFDLF
jgi:hypothetical protein